MPTSAQLAASSAQFITAADKAHQIVNGPATGDDSLVEVESGVLKTFARTLKEINPALAPLVPLAEWTGVFGYGQSLAVGSDGLPLVHTTPVFGHLTFNGGPDYPTGTDLDSSTPLFEVQSGTQGETPCSAFAEGGSQQLLARNDDDRILFCATIGMGSQPLSYFMPGTARYTDLVNCHTSAAALADTANKTYTTSVVWWLQGETDAAATTTQEDYFDDFSTLVSAIHANMGAITLTYQTVGYIANNPGPALAQLQADELDHCHLVTPIYFLSGGAIHLDTDSYQEVGQRMARAWLQLHDGRVPERIRLVKVVQEGEARVICHFTVPTAPLVWDVTRVPQVTDYGFQVEDETGVVALYSVTVGASTVVLVPVIAFVGDVTVRYGLNYETNGWTQGASGNLADSTPDVCWFSGVQRSLKHWCPAFSSPVIPITSPNYPSAAAGPETEAWEHWLLGGTSDSLTGLVHSRVLIPTGAAPTYDSKGIIIPATAPYNNGLNSGFSDNRSNFTVMVVLTRQPGDAGYVITLGTLKLFGEDGCGFETLAGTKTTISMLTVNEITVSVDWHAEQNIHVGDWAFLVYRVRENHPAIMICGPNNSNGILYELAATRTAIARNVNIGNPLVALADCVEQLKVAEAIYFEEALDEAAIKAIYRRSRTRMAKAGREITI